MRGACKGKRPNHAEVSRLEGCFLWLLLLLGPISVCHASAGIRAGPGKYFYDKTGRVITLRGLNVAGKAKVPEFTPFHNLAVLDSLAVFSANVARVPFTWEAYEPARGRYNQTYMDYIEDVVNYLGELGLLVMLDMHQDGLSRWLIKGCGDGFPFWTLPSEIYDELDDPNNADGCKSWKLNYVFDPLSATAWQSFHSNHNGIKDSFLTVWDHLSARFSNNSAILGYDMLNEPVGSESRQLSPLFEAVAKVIRKNDKDAILFLCPMYLLGNGGKSGLVQPTYKNYALAVHWYNQGSFTGMKTEEAFKLWFDMTETWDAPVFVGEFGVEPKAPGYGEAAPADMIEALYNYYDEQWLSWTQWFWTPDWTPENYDGWNLENYSVTDNRHNLRENYQIRPVPQAVAGDPILFKVDAFGKKMTLIWNVTEEALASNPITEVFAPIQGFFQAPAVAWLEIKVTAPEGSKAECVFVAPTENQFMLCKPTAVGVHRLDIQRAPGLPRSVSRNPFLLI